MTTAELGLVTTAIVGVAAAASPTLVGWANRKHERAMARSTRLYEQRRNAYRDLAVYLERARLGIGGRLHFEDPRTPETADHWTELMGSAAVAGSAEVQAKLAEFHEVEEYFYSSSVSPPQTPQAESPEEWQEYTRIYGLHQEFVGAGLEEALGVRPPPGPSRRRSRHDDRSVLA
jgi:hypothetical protein